MSIDIRGNRWLSLLLARLQTVLLYWYEKILLDVPMFFEGIYIIDVPMLSVFYLIPCIIILYDTLYL
jgi:hypothetical protein